jgi:hypothetical protein
MSSFGNFVQCRVISPVAIGATTIDLYAADAPYSLPPVGGGLLVLVDSPGNPSFIEVVRYTARSGQLLTGVTRGQEGTTARAWSGNIYAFQSLMAGDFQALLDAKQAAHANLTALSGLTGVADRLPYFTGAGALSLATLTAKARDLMASADESAMRSFLGLVKQTSTTDSGTGKLLTVDSFGLGAVSSVVFPSASLDSSDTPVGLYRASSTILGTWPTAAFNGPILVERINATTVKQTLTNATSNRTWVRGITSGVPTPWAELWHSGNLVKQTSTIDTTAGSVLLNGAHGLGELTLNTGNNLTDLNNINLATGFYAYSGSATGSPSGVNPGVLFVERYSAVASRQVAMVVNGSADVTDKWTRQVRSGPIYGAWVREYNQGNILGTVSQSSGVPTGALFESGSNANGAYLKFADGTMICTRQIFLASLGSAISYTTGLNRYAFTWTYPAVFSSASAVSGSGTDQAAVGFIGGLGSSSGSSSGHHYITPTNGLTSVTIRVIAIGRWFE